MRFIAALIIAGALLAFLINAGFYVWRTRMLRVLPDCDRIEPLGIVRAARACTAEWLVSIAMLLSIPLGWCVPMCRSGKGTRGPIILMHGWGLNRGALWLLRRRLLRDGWNPVCCMHYRAYRFGIERAAESTRALIDALTSTAGKPLTLIGHGLGGLVARYCARRYALRAVRRIVTLGTPHFGTELARRSPLRDVLAPGSPLLNKLNAVDHVPQQFDVIAIHSTFDAMVLPPGNARYPEAFNIEVDDIGHYALLFSTKVYQLIAENLAAPLA